MELWSAAAGQIAESAGRLSVGGCSDNTHIDLQQLLPLGGEVEGDPVHVAGKGGGPYQQDHQDAVGEQCCEVHQLEKYKTR